MVHTVTLFGRLPSDYQKLSCVDFSGMKMGSIPFFENNYSEIAFFAGESRVRFFMGIEESERNEEIDFIDFDVQEYGATEKYADICIYAESVQIDKTPPDVGLVGDFISTYNYVSLSNMSFDDKISVSALVIISGDSYFSVSRSNYEDSLIFYSGKEAVEKFLNRSTTLTLLNANRPF